MQSFKEVERLHKIQWQLSCHQSWYKVTLIFYSVYIYMLQEAKCAYAIIIMAVFWITEALPIAVTALLPVFLFPVVGLLSVKETSKQYINVSCVFLKLYHLYYV